MGLIRIALAALALAGCEAPCPRGQARANARDCVPACALDGDVGAPVFDADGVFAGECRAATD